MIDDHNTPETLWAEHDRLRATNPVLAARFAAAHRLDQVPRPATMAPAPTTAEPSAEIGAYRDTAKTNPVVAARAFLHGTLRK